MSLPEPVLDDLRFQQDLVDVARRRIIHYCPEWTDYNLSDPGITLIELFAWMTEMITYRLNRVPEKNYIKFMELLGVQLRPASSARTELTFWLSAPLPLRAEDEAAALTVVIPRGAEVATRRTEEEEEIIFTTDASLRIGAPQLTQLRREQDFNKNYLPRLGIEDFYAFDQGKPQEGNTFYLGFDEEQDISGHILQLTFECEETQAVGVRREDPPLVWECSLGDGNWEELSLSTRPGEKDTTGGLNNATGSLVMYLPLTMRPNQAYGRNGYWVRCRLEQRRPEQGMYAESPRIKNITAHTLGATARATHARTVENELLGHSNGEPGQIFYLENAPVLALREGETIEVEGEMYGDVGFRPWELVDEFSASEQYDRHFTLDTATGEVRFGPGIRQRDGTVRQYGRIPEAGRAIRFTSYRYGGGTAGNVPSGRLVVLKSSIAYVDRVANLHRAEGGRDQESLEEAKMRARRELQAQERAVTAADYEGLSLGASRAVARVKCQTPGESTGVAPGMVELLVVPAAFDALLAGDLSRLQLDETLRETIISHLDHYRLLTTTLRVREPRYLGIKVRAEILVSEYSQPESVRERVARRLRNFIAPLALEGAGELRDEFLGPHWEGWPFGRDLYVSEIYALIGQIPGIKHVWDIQVSQRPVAFDPDSSSEEPLALVQDRRLRVPGDTLLCSLDHEIEVVEE
ncbi:MAG: putative baseplate assembly protein [Anaerolineaceae bacterium 4572_32.1]|nr:MAG: putative baseplate assembly protein [Anaerolineaceae bacterium 4572_32.1]